MSMAAFPPVQAEVKSERPLCCFGNLLLYFPIREAQAFVEKFEGALGKGKGKKLYAYKMMMAKVSAAMMPGKSLDTWLCIQHIFGTFY